MTTVALVTWQLAAQRWTCGRPCGSQDGDRFIAPTDREGCDINAYRMGETNFYGAGPQFQVNTERPFKVVTRFHAPAGELTAIEQFYVQDGKEIHHPTYSARGDSIESDAFCAAQKTSFGDRNSFAEKGGMKKCERHLTAEWSLSSACGMTLPCP